MTLEITETAGQRHNWGLAAVGHFGLFLDLVLPQCCPRARGQLEHDAVLSMVSEDQIQQWVDEAEAGYDVEEMKRRGRGRPGRGAEPMQVVAVRLTAEELAAVDVIAEREHISRSEAIRRALADFAA